MNYQEVLNGIPEYSRFLTVDELDESTEALAKEYPDRISMKVIGHSRKGSPIRCLRIGTGARRVLAFACPHPNEPIGAMTLEYFSRYLAEHEEFLKQMDCTWYLIKCVDPDGTRLNEGWFSGPFTLRNYAEHYYRPAMTEQVEWTFPVDYKKLHFHSPIPETQALMKLIEEIRPDFLYSLHNAGFGGVFWYISKDRPEIYRKVTDVPGKYGIPLALGEPEMPCCVSLAPAVYKMLSVKDMYDFYEAKGIEEPQNVMSGGASSDEYANCVGDTLSLVCELPYFYNELINDESPSEMSKRDAMMHNCRRTEDSCTFLKEQMERIRPFIPESDPFRRMIENTVEMFTTENELRMQAIQQDPKLQEPAKKSEAFDNLYGMTSVWMNFVGLLPHMIDELQRNTKDPLPAVLEDARRAGQKKLDEMEAYITDHVQYEVIPIRKLVAVQLECAFIALDNM
ncbi:MAG: M14 family zinc carboxypeptidase [Lachnospiraceae bacterium]|nr:M14 family zinc carboxypeptidase [Lachnospiraceae bacterium]